MLLQLGLPMSLYHKNEGMVRMKQASSDGGVQQVSRQKRLAGVGRGGGGGMRAVWKVNVQ